MSAADNDRALVVFTDSLDPATLERLKALVDARVRPYQPKPPTDGPATYRGIEVTASLHHNWDQPEAHWWRLGVQDALGIAVPLVDALHYDSECSLDHHGYCQEHGLPGAIPCPDGEARKFLAASEEGTTTDE